MNKRKTWMQVLALVATLAIVTAIAVFATYNYSGEYGLAPYDGPVYYIYSGDAPLTYGYDECDYLSPPHRLYQ